MAEIKKVWLVHDYGTPASDPDELFTDPNIFDDEHRLAHLGFTEEAISFDQLMRIAFGGGVHTWWNENTKVYDDKASAKKDAESRLAKARKAFERRQKTASQRVADRHLDQTSK